MQHKNPSDPQNSASSSPSASSSSSLVAYSLGISSSLSISFVRSLAHQPHPRSHGSRRTPPPRPRYLLRRLGRKEKRPKGSVPSPFALPSLISPVLNLMHKGRHWVLVVSTLLFLSSLCSHVHRSFYSPTSSVFVSLLVSPFLTPNTQIINESLPIFLDSAVSLTRLFPRLNSFSRSVVVSRPSPSPRPLLV